MEKVEFDTTNTTRAYLYRWSEISTGKWYIGSRTAKNCHPNDGYICSSTTVKPLIQENPSNWKHEILRVCCDPKYIQKLEARVHRRLDAKNHPMSYNRANAGEKFSGLGLTLSTETRAKLSRALKGRTFSPETRAKIGAASKGRTPSPETIAKIVAKNTGRTRSPESRAKMSAVNKGRTLSPETRAKLSAANKGRTIPP